MRVQSFKSFIGKLNELKLSQALRTPRNTERNGIDLIDSTKGVEVKSCLIYPESENYKKRYVKWTLFDYELEWHKTYKGTPLYCALGTYSLNIPISKIGHNDIAGLEFFVSHREFWVVPWDWTLNFPIKQGIYHSYRYLRRKPIASSKIPNIPENKYTRKIDKGLLHFTQGVNMRHFRNL